MNSRGFGGVLANPGHSLVPATRLWSTLSKEYFNIVDRVKTYLYYTRYNAITYRGNKESKLLIYRDVSFIDKLEIRKLS